MHYHANQPIAPYAPNEHFQRYQLIEPVVLIYGNMRRLHADEHNHAGRLLKTLDWIGREGIALRSVVRPRCVLSTESVRALGLYLRHGKGLTAFRRTLPTNAWKHRHAWEELQTLLSLRWVR
ncbi:hypothetical protein [Oleiharenicola sp. Vm1]|uniref:hypothetical protein n=1 Tax=Oleiharenicola sp. Vm1 TaxID=3398393 RepID=UPI0039F56945